MLINIRGANGSGKSSTVRELLALSEKKEDIYIEGRKKPIYSVWALKTTGKLYAVMGHYDVPSGGCDTIKNMSLCFFWIKEALKKVDTVVAEGIMLSVNVNGMDIPETRVVYINIPLADCYEGVRQRRIALGEIEKSKIPPKTLEDKWKAVRSACRRLKGKAEVVEVTEREKALPLVINLLEE